jgi:hypothetical protein
MKKLRRKELQMKQEEDRKNELEMLGEQNDNKEIQD